jgi:hypothetical protein
MSTFSSPFDSSERPAPKETAGPAGIAGWLILPAIGRVVSPILVGISLLTLLSASKNPNSAATAGGPMGPCLVLLGWLGFEIFLSAAFFAKKAFVPGLMVSYFVMAIVLNVIMASWIAEAVGPSASGGADTGRAIVVAVIWMPYFLVSRRVKATFVN